MIVFGFGETRGNETIEDHESDRPKKKKSYNESANAQVKKKPLENDRACEQDSRASRALHVFSVRPKASWRQLPRLPRRIHRRRPRMPRAVGSRNDEITEL